MVVGGQAPDRPALRQHVDPGPGLRPLEGPVEGPLQPVIRGKEVPVELQRQQALRPAPALLKAAAPLPRGRGLPAQLPQDPAGGGEAVAGGVEVLVGAQAQGAVGVDRPAEAALHRQGLQLRLTEAVQHREVEQLLPGLLQHLGLGQPGEGRQLRGLPGLGTAQQDVRRQGTQLLLPDQLQQRLPVPFRRGLPDQGPAVQGAARDIQKRPLRPGQVHGRTPSLSCSGVLYHTWVPLSIGI